MTRNVDYLAAAVRDALANDPRTAALGLEARVVADRLYISGAAASDEQRRAIGAVASENADGLPVQNDVTVVSCDESADAEDLD